MVDICFNNQIYFSKYLYKFFLAFHYYFYFRVFVVTDAGQPVVR